MKVMPWFPRILYAALILFSSQLNSQLSERAEISLLSCDPGNDLYALFGHSAIRISDPVSGLDEVYNYGTFDFSDPDFLSKFLRGKLMYWLNKEQTVRFIRTYDYLKRSVKEEKLVLDSLQKTEFYKALEENSKEGNRYYLYDFLFDNCSTRIAEIMESLFGPYAFEQEPSLTFRNQLHQYLIGRDWTQFGIDLIVASRADAKASVRQQMFLPDYLSSHLAGSVGLNKQKNLMPPQILVSHERMTPSSYWITPILLFTILLILELLYLRYKTSYLQLWMKHYDNLWLFIMVVSSLILLFMWFGTDHKNCGENYNLVIFSPLLAFLAIGKLLKAKKIFLSIISLLIIVPFISIPFIRMGVQEIHPAVLIIAIITTIKLFRIGSLSNFRKWV